MHKIVDPLDQKKEWSESIKLEEARGKLAVEFETKKTELLGQVATSKDRLEEMTSNTIEKAESELPEKIACAKKEQEDLYLVALAEVDRLREALSELPLDDIVERSFLVVSGLKADREE